VPAGLGTLEGARRRSGLSVQELWFAYFSLGGDASQLEMEAFLQGALQPAPIEYDKVAHALNEHFSARGQDHPVPYWDAEELEGGRGGAPSA
jgi:hypothetical protein